MMQTQTSDRRHHESRFESDPIEWSYLQHVKAGLAISFHLNRLRALATGCDLAIEFGVKRGASTTALLLGADRVISYDLVQTPEARDLQKIAGDRWEFRLEDSRFAEPALCDLLFLDSLHTFDQVHDELAHHGNFVRRYLVFHDVTTFGEVGADGETGRARWTYEAGKGSVPRAHWGIRPAIDLWCIAHPEWQIVERSVESHGLLVLERRS